MGEDGLLAPLLVAQAQFVPEKACCGAFAGTDIYCPFSQGSSTAGGARQKRCGIRFAGMPTVGAARPGAAAVATRGSVGGASAAPSSANSG